MLKQNILIYINNIKKRITKRDIILFISFILTCVIGISNYYFSSSFFTKTEEFDFNKEKSISLYPDSVISIQNYDRINNQFYTLQTDPQINILPPEQKIASTLIEFVEPIPIDTSVQIYFAKNNNGLSEENSVIKFLKKGTSEIIINLPPAVYTSLRYDIQIIGEPYEIKGIYVSEKKSAEYLYFQYLKYIVISSFLILATFLVFLTVKRINIEFLYLFAGIGIGLFYLLLMTPLSIPDEQHHYQSAHLLANYLSFQEDKNVSKISYFDYSYLQGHYNVSSAYQRLAEEGIKQDKNDKYTNIPRPYKIGYFILYVPQALGVLIARFLNLNFFGVFYLGRFTNLIFYVMCVFCAIKSVNEFKLPLFIIGLLPMSIHQAASFSYDAFINGISIVFIAYLIRILYESKEISKKDILALSITGILLAPAKLVYFPIVSLVFLVLPERYGWKKAKGYIIAVGIFIIGLAMLLLFFHDEIIKSTQQSNNLNWEGQHNYTISFIMGHPKQTIAIFLNTINTMGTMYYQSMIGRYLSGLSLGLPRWYIAAFLIILLGSVFYCKKISWSPKRLHRILFLFVIFSVILLCMLSMFLFWTSDTRDIIQGVQGRYFIPLIPLGLLLLKNKYFSIKNKIYSFVLIGCIIGMQFLTIRYILYTTIGF